MYKTLSLQVVSHFEYAAGPMITFLGFNSIVSLMDVHIVRNHSSLGCSFSLKFEHEKI